MEQEQVLQENRLSKSIFIEYIQKNRYAFIIGAIFLLLIYGSQIYVLNARADTDIAINDPKSTAGWLGIGRQGAILSRILFERFNFNPYFASSFSFVILIISMVVFSFLFFWLGKMPANASVILFLMFLVHPIFVEQFYFTLQVLEVSFAILLIAISLLTSIAGILYRGNSLKILSVFCMIWAFSTYQLFVILYIAGAIFCFLLLYRRISLEDHEKLIDIKIYAEFIFKLILLFGLAMAINTGITHLFFNNSSYTADMIQWGKQPLKNCIISIIGHVYLVITGNGIFYSLGYIISAVLMAAAIIYGICHKRTAKLKWLYLLAAIGLQVCPFLLTIYEGNIPPARAQFVLPFVIACNMGFVVMCCGPSKNKRAAALLVSVVILLVQTQTVMRLEYTDDIRFQEDMRLGSQISEKVAAVTDGAGKPIAFVGTKPATLNAACIRGEMIGMSIFSWGSTVQPHYFQSSNRISTLLQTMGFQFKNVSADQMLEARKTAHDMPVWPAQGSVQEMKDYVIVKLSEDEWYADDIMKAEAEKIELKKPEFQNSALRWAVDNVSIKEGAFSVSGWLIQPGASSKNAKIQVYLWNEINGSCYQLSTANNQRPDVSKAFPNEADYNNSGFLAKAPLSELDQDLSNYKVIVSYENGSKKIFANTNVSIKN